MLRTAPNAVQRGFVIIPGDFGVACTNPGYRPEPDGAVPHPWAWCSFRSGGRLQNRSSRKRIHASPKTHIQPGDSFFSDNSRPLRIKFAMPPYRPRANTRSLFPPKARVKAGSAAVLIRTSARLQRFRIFALKYLNVDMVNMRGSRINGPSRLFSPAHRLLRLRPSRNRKGAGNKPPPVRSAPATRDRTGFG